ncbi:hypothetical protein [Streptomyces chryseus]|uniref:VapC45 PIN like domain-containing protein n=1 Tax=Streptomyces chryseus TaxID=68186 RepID=A0ABQ3DTS3_9ACTN|nr:hypothetical protein [Streptomyces chryseus]GGW96999.1 hypothetical protein GCM10010353_10410 [Streptomyces chryseus]GHB16198.1 hypothetical protein GCM10010346_44940 [Streptomyces chryseus]
MPPEFFLDRNPGRRLAEELRALGWRVHRIGQVFPADAQDVPDEEWIIHGLAVARGGPAACAVRSDGLDRTWP